MQVTCNAFETLAGQLCQVVLRIPSVLVKVLNFSFLTRACCKLAEDDM